MSEIALVGVPNVGKSTLFNLLSGAAARVGNYEGITVTSTSKALKTAADTVLVDLPGINSLGARGAEEKETKDFLGKGRISGIVCVLDGTSLRRSLALALELLSLGKPLILAINMADELERQGVSIDIDGLGKELGVKAVLVSAEKKTGIQNLLNLIQTMDSSNGHRCKIKPLDNLSRFREADILIAKYVRSDKTVQSIPGRLDRLLLHPLAAYPMFLFIFAAIFFLAFGLTESLAGMTVGAALEAVKSVLGDFLTSVNADRFLISLLTEGILTGLAAVLELLPSIAVLYFLIGLVEDSGYLARLEFIFERPLSAVGLSGKAIIYILLGFGCFLPAVSQTRLEKDIPTKRRALRLIPCLICSAKLPLVALVARLVFDCPTFLVLLPLYLGGLTFGLLLVFFSPGYSKADRSYIAVFPPYRRPSLVTSFKLTGRYLKDMSLRLLAWVFLSGLVFYLLSHLDFRFQTAVFEHSILGMLSTFIAPIFSPLGFSPVMCAGLLTGLVAKEAALGSLVGAGNAFMEVSLSTSCAFLVFYSFYSPCLATVGLLCKEARSKKWAFGAVTIQTALSYVIALVSKLIIDILTI